MVMVSLQQPDTPTCRIRVKSAGLPVHTSVTPPVSKDELHVAPSVLAMV